MRAVIFGGGRCNVDLTKYIIKDDFIVCADSGYDCAVKAGYKPHLVVGDMDSIVNKIPPEIEVITAPVQKDETDSMLCIDLLKKRGFDEMLFLGALGGRIDHSFANISLLLYARERGIDLKITDGNSTLFVIDDTAEICGNKGDLLSLFAIGGEASYITANGVFYPLECETLLPGIPRGVSNELISDKAKISVKQGYLLVIHTKSGGETNE